MSNKSVLYIVIAIVMTVFLQSLRDVTIEFIKSAKEESQSIPSLFMMPGQGLPLPQMNSYEKYKVWAANE